MAGEFTAAVFLVALATLFPNQYRKDPKRMATIAVAAELAQTELLPRWRLSSRELGGAILTAIVHESGAARVVHDGSVRSRTNDICLVQINPGNGNWRLYTDNFDDLAGTGVVATRLCLLVGIETMIRSVNHCWAQRYRKNWRQAMWSMYAFGSRCWIHRSAFKRAADQQRFAWTNWTPTSEHIQLVRGVSADD